MEWPAGRELDNTFGPRFPHEFDLTLRFEHIFLTIIPSLVFILAALCYLRYYARQPVCTRSGGLKWVELVVAGFLIAVEIATLGLWCTPDLRSGTAVGAAVLSCVAAVVLAILVGFEFHRSFQSSVLTGLYLLLNTLFGIAKTRSYFLRTLPALAGLSISSVAFQLFLLVLLEIPKTSAVSDRDLRQTIGKEAVTGFWNRTFFVWLNPTFIAGLRSVLTVKDLSVLGPEFSSERLLTRFNEKWTKASRSSGNVLLKASLQTFYAEVLFIVPPQLCLSAFKLVQPLYLRRVILFIGETNPSSFVRTGLILSCILIFIGLAACRALAQHLNYRSVTMVRGALVPSIFKKTLNLPYSVAKDSAAATLMSTDIEGISTGIPKLHDIWSGFIEVIAGLYILSTIIDKATFLVVLPVLISVILSYFLGKYYAKNLGVWNAKIQERVALTTKMLLQVKTIKMIGLEEAIIEKIKGSRAEEIDSFRTFRIVGGASNMVAILTFTTSPMLAIAGGLFWTTFNGRLTAVNAFTTLAIIAIVINPLTEILKSYPQLKGISACFTRIQKYLVLEEVQSRHRISTHSSEDTEEPKLEKKTDDIIRFEKASITPAAGVNTILHNVTFNVQPSQFTVVLGPVGAGKTTLLRAILGEAAVCEGDFRRNPGNLAYCGQKPWLRNVSIRANIIATSGFEKAWYDEVIAACCLVNDLDQLPGSKGDKSLAGSNGSNLSGGQRHRVALARALYSREPVLLLDDVLSGLDTDMSQDISSRLFGTSGLLRKSGTTVVFATHSIDFLKLADQALILDENGAISVQSKPSELVLAKSFIARLNYAASNNKTGTDSYTDATPPTQSLQVEDDVKSRSRSDASLYKYIFETMSPKKTLLLLFLLVLMVGSERFPEAFMRIWLETDPGNNTYFAGYAAIGGTSIFTGSMAIGFYFLHMIPENGIKIHSALLDSVFGAKLSFLSSTDAGSLVNRFSQDMTILTQQLPFAMWSVGYIGMYVIYDIAIVVSGAKYAALMLPFIIAVFYVLQLFYLRTSRQIRYLDIEAKSPLYTLFTDISSPNGLEHIRAFGWETYFLKESIYALDFSQSPYYYMYTVQRWLELAMDLVSLCLAFILVTMTVFFRQTTTEAGIGLSLLSLIGFGSTLNFFVSGWTRLETSLGALARLRTFISSTPQEGGNCEDCSHVPQQWPQLGTVEFSNVSAKYQVTDSSPVLNNASLQVEAGQKVGIMGRSGSGKTSLLLTLLGLMEYTGTIKIDNIDVSSVPKGLLRSRITTISQDAVQLAGSVKENLLPYIGQDNGKIDDTLLLRTLDRVGLAETISSKGGLDASLAGMSLSEGQMQFLCLARAMLHNHWTGAKLILMDEPTSNMDYETDARIQALVREAFDDCTILMISHREEAIADANVLLEVSSGSVSKRDRPATEAIDGE